MRQTQYDFGKQMKFKPLGTAVLLLILLGCASLPDAGKIIGQTKRVAAAPRITGASGPLSAEESRKALEEAGATTALRRHLAIEQIVSETPLVEGNYVQILENGRETFPAIFSAIEHARDHVNLEYYILENVESGGVKLSDLLIRKKKQGVAINIIYDSFGSSETGQEFFNSLKAAGISLLQYAPLNPLESRTGLHNPNERNHRKILVVDGSYGVVGGINLSDSYENKSVGKSGGADGVPGNWRDLVVEIKGPVVAQLEELFLQHWKQEKGPPLNLGTFFPEQKEKGAEIVRIIGSAPENEIPRYYVTLLSAIRNAQEKIWLMAGYFVPTDETKQDLMAAARRGVDVRVLVPAITDSRIMIAAQRSHYAELLKAGVKIYESQGKVLHSKAVVVDGVWTVVGSSNIDNRSALFNDEVDAVILGEKTGADYEQVYIKNLNRARQIDPAKWPRRSFSSKFYETISKTIQFIL